MDTKQIKKMSKIIHFHLPRLTLQKVHKKIGLNNRIQNKLIVDKLSCLYIHNELTKHEIKLNTSNLN